MIRSSIVSTERQKMLAGEMYDPLDRELVAARVRARNLCQELTATQDSDTERRRRLLCDLFGKGGDTKAAPCGSRLPPGQS